MLNTNCQVNTLDENFEILVEKARLELFKGYQLKRGLEKIVYFPGLLTSVSNFSIATISAYITLGIISEILDKPFDRFLNNSTLETSTPETLTYFVIIMLLLFQMSGFWLWVKPIWLILLHLIYSQKQELPTFITFFLWSLIVAILFGITQLIPALWFESSVKLYHNHFIEEDRILWIGLCWVGFFPFITYLLCTTINFTTLLIDIIVLQNPKTRIKQINSFIDKPLTSLHNLKQLTEKELNDYAEFSITHRNSIEKILLFTSLVLAIFAVTIDIVVATDEARNLIDTIIETLKLAQGWQALFLGFVLGSILAVINVFLSLIWDSFHILIAHNFLQETFVYLKISQEYEHPIQNQISEKYCSKYKLIALFVLIIMILNHLKKLFNTKN